MISLDTAGHLVVGSKTQTFGIGSVSEGGEIVGGSGDPTGPFAGTATPSVVVQGDNSNGTGSVAATGVQGFTGEAGGRKGDVLTVKAVVGILGGLVLRALIT